jgi:hypothetical protein
MNMPRNGEYAEMMALIQKSIEPLISKLDNKVDRLADKVDELARNRVTREDLEKIEAKFVPRSAYEPRHLALESDIKKIESQTQMEFQRLHERLESGKQQIEDRFKEIDKEIDDMGKGVDDKLKEKNQAELSEKDKGWIRAGQIGFFVSLLIVIADFVSQHIGFH